jgi:ABC-type multidrug transport system ATPase subunit
MAPAIAISDASIKFGTFTAVDKVSFDVHAGEVFGLLGPNGSGKTTLIRALCGLVPFAEGRAELLGRDVNVDPEWIRQSVGYMSQKFSLYGDLTVRENMDFYAGIYGLPRSESRKRQDELIALTGLGPYLSRLSARLSGGWKQRLALVCALLHRPKVVFLDEPTAGIDPVARRDLWDLLFQLAATGVTLFVTTHYMDEAERCGRVGYLYLSKLLALGTPDELRKLPEITPPGTRRVEITGGKPAEMLGGIRRTPGVREATVFGLAVHALIENTVMPADLGLTAEQVRDVTPSLEDVFVTLAQAQKPAA